MTIPKEDERTPGHFRKKPVVIEAIHFTEDVALSSLADNEPGPFGFGVSGDWHAGRRQVMRAWVSIETLEGVMRAELGDWIIKGVKGEFYPCKPDIFAATYEPAEGNAYTSTEALRSAPAETLGDLLAQLEWETGLTDTEINERPSVIKARTALAGVTAPENTTDKRGE